LFFFFRKRGIGVAAPCKKGQTQTKGRGEKEGKAVYSISRPRENETTHQGKKRRKGVVGRGGKNGNTKKKFRNNEAHLIKERETRVLGKGGRGPSPGMR